MTQQTYLAQEQEQQQEAAPAPAAPAAPAPVQSAEAEAKDRAALIAELDAEDGGDGDAAPPPKKPASGGKQKTEPAEEDDDAEATDGEDGDAGTESEDGEEDAEELAFETPDEFREHVKSLIEAGDIRKVEEALGLEEGALKVNAAKLRHIQQERARTQAAVAQAANKEREATNLIETAKQFYGPFVLAKQAFQGGTPSGIIQAARAVEGHFGVPIATFVEAVLKAGKGEGSKITPTTPAPESSDLALLRAEIQELKNARVLEQQQQQGAVAEQRHLGIISGKLKGTPLAAIKDAPKLVYDRIRSSYNQQLGGYQLDLAGAIKATLADPGTKWRLHELKTKKVDGKAPKTATGPTLVRKRTATQEVKLTPAQQEKAEKARLIAEIDAEFRREERAQRKRA